MLNQLKHLHAEILSDTWARRVMSFSQRAASRTVLCLMVILSAISPAWAQSGNVGSVEGTVADPTGAVIPGASLHLRNLETSARRETATNEAGLFRFPILPVGIYELVVERDGFAALTETNLVVTVGAAINLSLTLQLAGVSERVVVSSTPLLETTRSQVSTTIDSRAISSLPVNGRNFLDFVLLIPGVTRSSRGQEGASFAGQRFMSLLQVDGVDNDNTFFGGTLGLSGSTFAPYQFSLATVQEFQVKTNSYSAEHGRVGAGLIDVVTKSGTNQFHGGAFWYYRDRSLNATDLINKLTSQPKSPYHFNQFGGTLGGPLRKDRLFFFVNFDGQRSALENVVFLNLPPGFQFSPDATVASFQRRALGYLAARGAPWLRTFDENVYFAKLDWHINPAHVLTARWNRQRFTGGGNEGLGPQISFEHTGTALSRTDTLALSLTSTLSSSMVNVARFSYVRSREPSFPNSADPEANVLQAGQVVLTIGRTPMDPRENFIRRFQWSDTLSYVRGRHALKFGVDIPWNLITFFTSANFSGSFRFTSLESFGRSLAGAPAPQPGESYTEAFSGEGMPGATTHPDFVEFGGFVQDEWRARSNLTLNLGLRYDLQAMAKPPVRNPSPVLLAAGLDTSFVPRDWNNVAPRVGFAWTPLRSNGLVVRGGYGIFYWRTPSVLSSRPHFQNGVTVQTHTLFAGTPQAALIPSYPNTLCGPPDPSGVPPSCVAPAAAAGNPFIILFARDYVEPYTQQGSLGFEVGLSNDFALSATYLLVKGTHLQRLRDINLGTPTAPANIGIAGTTTVLTFQKFTLPRPLAGFDRILLWESAASSIYHGLAVQLTKRYARHFQFMAAYTFAKVIDDAPEPAVMPTGAGDVFLLSDASNPRADRSAGGNDQRHRFVLSGIWQLDYASKLPPAAKAILGGWELSGILTAQSGQPYSGMVNFDLNNDGNSSNDRTPGLGRSTFYLPSTVSFDPRVTRNVQLTEHAKLQFIWEAFNVFNHGNVTAARTTQYARSVSPAICGIAGAPCLVPQDTGVSAFGVPTATSGPRIMQLSAKLVF